MKYATDLIAADSRHTDVSDKDYMAIFWALSPRQRKTVERLIYKVVGGVMSSVRTMLDQHEFGDAEIEIRLVESDGGEYPLKTSDIRDDFGDWDYRFSRYSSQLFER